MLGYDCNSFYMLVICFRIIQFYDYYGTNIQFFFCILQLLYYFMTKFYDINPLVIILRYFIR